MRDFFTAVLHADPVALLRAGGYAGIAFMVFAESGLLFGVVFPGDSLLFAAGLLAAARVFNPVLLVPLVVAASALGGFAGYALGHRYGPGLFAKEDALIFKRAYVTHAEAFFSRYGNRAILFARFVPIVRAFVPPLAGVARMDFKAFSAYTLLGSALWGAGIVAAGYFLGALMPNANHYITALSIGIIVISFLPVLLSLLRSKFRSTQL